MRMILRRRELCYYNTMVQRRTQVEGYFLCSFFFLPNKAVSCSRAQSYNVNKLWEVIANRDYCLHPTIHFDTIRNTFGVLF